MAVSLNKGQGISLKKSENYKKVIQNLENTKTEAFNDIQNQKNNIKVQKKLRDEIRKSDSYSEEELKEASKKEGILLKKMTQFWNYKIEDSQKEFDLINSKIEALKLDRKQKSAGLQQRLFAEYAFLNQFGILKSIGEIFEENPPAGAGECAAPKLLHYAFANNLKPIAMAEFWWGKSPNSEIRKHKRIQQKNQSKSQPNERRNSI